MKITHTLMFNNTSEKKKFFEALNFSVNEGFVHIEVDDADPRWNTIVPRIKEFEIFLNAKIIYTKKELNSTEWFQMNVSESLYPQPEDDFKYKSLTYNLTEYCPTCGVGYVQDKPYRLNSDFPNKRSMLMGLHWAFDAVFIRPEVKELLDTSDITGITFSHPIYNKSEKEIRTVYQLNIKKTLEPGFIYDESQIVTCKPNNEENASQAKNGNTYCYRKKYHYYPSGELINYKPLAFHKEIFRNASDFVISNEWFGSGYSAHHLNLVSNRVYKFISAHKWRGIRFWPIELV